MKRSTKNLSLPFAQLQSAAGAQNAQKSYAAALLLQKALFARLQASGAAEAGQVNWADVGQLNRVNQLLIEAAFQLGSLSADEACELGVPV